MPITLGVDLGTTTITALALDISSGEVLARRTCPTTELTHPDDRVRGRYEAEPHAMTAAACGCLRELGEVLGRRRRELAGIGITGQQHGVAVINDGLSAETPFIGWQDRRGLETIPGTAHNYVERAAALLGEGAPRRTG